jgi:hypothetical protein
MRNLTAIAAAAGALALAVPVVSTDALAGSARHHAKKADRTVETTGSISGNKPMRSQKDMSQPNPGGAPKDVSKRSSWGGG